MPRNKSKLLLLLAGWIERRTIDGYGMLIFANGLRSSIDHSAIDIHLV